MVKPPTKSSSANKHKSKRRAAAASAASGKPDSQPDSQPAPPTKTKKVSKKRRISTALLVICACIAAWNDQKLRLSDVIRTSTLFPTTDSDETHALSSSVGVEPDDDFPQRNVRIAFVGDSLTRYTYLTLVHYLHFNEWPKHNDRFVTLAPRSNSRQWNEFFNYTSSLVHPHESCDCYRNWPRRFQYSEHVENRYYIDDERNIKIIFIGKFGRNPTHGHWTPDLIQASPQPLNFTTRPYAWTHPSYSDLIREYVQPFEPDYFILNEGHWPDHTLKDPAVVQEIRDTLNGTGITGIYRTTSSRHDDMEFGQHDAHVCSMMDYCWNVSWTKELPKNASNFVDYVHLHAEPNIGMVQQLLDILHDIRKNPK